MTIVAIEGIDASGKETQAELLRRFAAQRGFEGRVKILDFPHYQSPTGKLIRRFLTQEISCFDNLNGVVLPTEERAMILQSLYHANRHECSDVIRQYEDDNTNLLICDRYWMSGLVYGSAEGLDRAWYLTLAAANIQPDHWFLIDVTVEESMRRRPERQDYYEKNEALLRKVRGLYVEAFHTLPECIPESDFHILDGMRSTAEVHADICKAIFGFPAVESESLL